MLLTIKYTENRAQLLEMTVEHGASQGDVTVFADGHLSVERHLRDGGAPHEGVLRALAIYREQGIAPLCAALSGEFAMVILDGAKLLLVADCLDNAPLYWGEGSLPRGGRALCIGTSLAEVAEELTEVGGQRCVPDKIFLTAYLASATHLLLNTLRTPIEGIRRVPGGHYMTLNLNTGDWYRTRYWNPAEISPLSLDVPAAVERLDEIIEGAVRECFAYGPVGISVSGGLDSGSVMAYASRVAPEQTHCLTFGSDKWKTIPEDKHARQNVESARLKLTVVNCDEATPFRRFEPNAVYTYGLPVNVLAEYHHLLADTAQSLGAVTMLDGDGGDEFFGIGRSPRYLMELLKMGRVRRAFQDMRGWSRNQAVSPWNIAMQALRRPERRSPRLQPWLLRASETTALFTDPAAHVPADLVARADAQYIRMSLTENWWSGSAVYRPRGMRLLHPLRARELAELTYAVPRWILQNPADYKWLLRRAMQWKFPWIPFEPVNNDYSHLITHGVRLAKERLTSYFGEDCRLVTHGVTTPEIGNFARMYLRDPAGGEHWAPDGEEVVGQVALFAEMWLRGYEEVYGK